MIEKTASFMPLNQINRLNSPIEGSAVQTQKANAFDQFGQMMTEGVGKVNESLNQFENMSQKFARGERVSLHELMLTGEHAEINFKMMNTIKNKVVEAYQEVMRLQV